MATRFFKKFKSFVNKAANSYFPAQKLCRTLPLFTDCFCNVKNHEKLKFCSKFSIERNLGCKQTVYPFCSNDNLREVKVG